MTQEAVPMLAAAIVLVAASKRVLGATPDFSPIRTRTKSEATYEEVRSRILDGSLGPGSPINQRQLAHALGVSIIPLREALARLEGEELVQRGDGGSLHVTPLSESELIDLVAMKGHLEPFAAGLAASNGTSPQRQALTVLTSNLQVAAPQEWRRSHRVFHELVSAMTFNRVLILSLEQIWARLDRYHRPDLRAADEIASAALSHQNIADGICMGDSTHAVAAMAAHLDPSGFALAEVRR
ncbi:MAG: GntR family transcriptional regulator [Acidobacteriaceae bacterium]